VYDRQTHEAVPETHHRTSRCTQQQEGVHKLFMLYKTTVLHPISDVFTALEIQMTEEITVKPVKIRKTPEAKITPIGRLTLLEVDLALAACEKMVKAHIETVKAKLATNSSIPANVLRELSRGNNQKVRIMFSRISLLMETGDAAVMELLDKLMKVKPSMTAT
jgi:hypothetical protein